MAANFINTSGNIIANSGNFTTLTINGTSINNFNENIDDRVNSLLVAGTGINLSYNDNSNALTINLASSAVSGYEILTSNKSIFTVSQGYLSNNLNVYVNGSKLILGEDYTASNGSTFTLTQTAASGDIIEWQGLGGPAAYSELNHTHSSSDITNFNSSVSGLLPTIANSGDNRILTSTGSGVGINAEANLTFNGSLLNVVGSGSFSSQTVFASGTAAAPGISILGDTDTGIGQLSANGTNSLSIMTSGVERVTINSAGNVGIGTSPITGDNIRINKNLTGSTSTKGFFNIGSVQSDCTSSCQMFATEPYTQATSFTLSTLTHYQAAQGTFGAGSIVTNQIGYAVSSNLTGATNNFGFYSDIASGSNRWNFYAAGTANNYFAGNVGIGTSSPSFKLDVSGAGRIGNGVSQGSPSSTDIKATAHTLLSGTGGNYLAFGQYGSGSNYAQWIQSSFDNPSTATYNLVLQPLGGNVGIGSTSPSVKLDVYGADAAISVGTSSYGRFQTSGGNAIGYMYGSFAALGDGIHLTYNHYHNAAGTLVISNSGGFTSRITAGYGAVMFATSSAANVAPTERMRITSDGSVGIGTSSVSSGFRVDIRGRLLSYTTASDGLITVQGLQAESAGTGKAAIQIDVNGKGGFAWQNDASSGTRSLKLIENAGYGSGDTTLVTVLSGGNVGIGISPSTLLHLNSLGVLRLQTGSVTMDCTPTAGATDSFVWNTSANAAYRWSMNGQERMRIESDGKLYAYNTYGTTVGATNRDLFIDDTGKLGYVSSIRASKTNIAAIDDVSWLRDLTPVSFFYRRRNEDGTYSDEPDGTLDYGLIAEDVESVAPELCFYDIVDDNPELRGVHYSKLITPMLKYIQQLEDRIVSLETRLGDNV